MPDDNGVLSEEEIATIRRWLEARQRPGIPHCPLCQSDDWSILDRLVRGEVYLGRNILLGGAHYVYVAVQCLNCAYTMLFNAVMIEGLIHPDDPQPTGGQGNG